MTEIPTSVVNIKAQNIKESILTNIFKINRNFSQNSETIQDLTKNLSNLSFFTRKATKSDKSRIITRSDRTLSPQRGQIEAHGVNSRASSEKKLKTSKKDTKIGKIGKIGKIDPKNKAKIQKEKTPPKEKSTTKTTKKTTKTDVPTTSVSTTKASVRSSRSKTHQEEKIENFDPNDEKNSETNQNNEKNVENVENNLTDGNIDSSLGVGDTAPMQRRRGRASVVIAAPTASLVSEEQDEVEKIPKKTTKKGEKVEKGAEKTAKKKPEKEKIINEEIVAAVPPAVVEEHVKKPAVPTRRSARHQP
jgi:hypothetical protein